MNASPGSLAACFMLFFCLFVCLVLPYFSARFKGSSIARLVSWSLSVWSVLQLCLGTHTWRSHGYHL